MADSEQQQVTPSATGRLFAQLRGADESARPSDFRLKVSAAMQGASASGDRDVLAGLTFLQQALSLPLNADSRHEPFGEPVSVATRLGLVGGRLADGERWWAEALLAESEVPAVTARLGDLLWILNRDHQAARRAVGAYLEVASHPSERWQDEVAALARAASLSKTLGKRGGLHRSVLDVVAQAARQAEVAPDVRAQRLLILAFQYGALGSAEVADRAETHARAQDANGRFDLARACWIVAAEGSHAAGDSDRWSRCLQAVADTHVAQAEGFAANTTLGTNFHNAAHALQQAIEAQRAVPGSRERIDRLKRRLVDVQELATGQMLTHTQEFPLSAVFAELQRDLSSRPLSEALHRLGECVPLMNKREALEHAARGRERSFTRRWFPHVYHDSRGRVVAREPGNEDEAVESDALYAVRLHQQVCAPVIRHAVDLVMDEHAVAFADVVELLQHHPFVARGRLLSVARGLHFGLQGDHLIAVHLLVPQLEQVLRQTLNRLGVPTAGLSTAGIQDEAGLNALLTEDRYVQPLEDLFGEDWVFTLRATLIDRFGTNVRNTLAHGLEDDAVYSGPEGVYTWALAWKLYSMVSARAAIGDAPANEDG